jgi:predicted nucleotidyltransferase
MDIASIASAESKEQIVRILADSELHDRLVMHMLRGESRLNEPIAAIEGRLAEFKIGLLDWPGP